jgi:hypothetical protein
VVVAIVIVSLAHRTGVPSRRRTRVLS